jgi:type 1 glutamine amidotransferase
MRFAFLIPSSLLLFAAAADAQTRVFLIAGNSADHTPSSRAARPVIEKLGAELGLEVDYTEDLSLLTEANLAKYQIFLQMNLYPFNMTATHRTALEKFMNGGGKSWVGVHAAGCVRSDWPWMVKLLGGVTWVSHPALQQATFLIEDTRHPITAGVAPSFRIRDEWYEFSGNPRANVHVLGKVDETTYTQNRKQGDHPLIWICPGYDRAVYISVGHDPADWSHAEYMKIIRNALVWAKPAPNGIGGRNRLGTPYRKDRFAGREGLRILDVTGRDLGGAASATPALYLPGTP